MLPSPHHSRSGLANGRSRELVFRRTARPGRARRRLRGTQPCLGRVNRPARSSARSPRTRSPTSTHPACGRQSGDRDQRGRPRLGGRGRASGLPPALPERLRLPLPAAGLELPHRETAAQRGAWRWSASRPRRGLPARRRSRWPERSQFAVARRRSLSPSDHRRPVACELFVAGRAAHTLMQRGRRRRGPRGASGPASDRSAASNAKWTPPLGTGGHLGAQIEEKRTQFATIVPSTLRRENVRNCRDYAAVREIQAHD